MKKVMLALVALVGAAGVGRADDMAIVMWLKAKGKVYWQASNDREYFLGLPGHVDDDLGVLCELPHLQTVQLTGAGFTDAGLRQIEGLKGLLNLILMDCPNITPAAVERLQKALPKCKIER